MRVIRGKVRLDAAAFVSSQNAPYDPINSFASVMRAAALERNAENGNLPVRERPNVRPRCSENVASDLRYPRTIFRISGWRGVFTKLEYLILNHQKSVFGASMANEPIF
jgi:hypothetical protein